MTAVCPEIERLGRYARLLYPVLARVVPADVWSGEGDHARCCRTIATFWLLGAFPWPLVFAFVYGVMLSCRAGLWICLASFALFAPVPTLLRLTRSPRLCGNWVVAVMLATLTALGCITGGDGSPALTWLLVVPLVAIHVTGPRNGLFWCIVTVLDLVVFDVLAHRGVRVVQLLTAEEMEILAVLGNIGLVLLTAVLASAYDAQRHEALGLAQDRQLRLHEALARTEDHVVELARRGEALRESEALYRSLVQNSPMGMYFYELRRDGVLVLTDANPAAERLTGVAAAPLLGLPIEQAFPKVAETEVPERFRAAARDGAVWTADQLAYDDGRIAGAFELRAFQTSPGKMVVVFMNVADRLRAEAAVRASEREIALQAGKAEVATDVLHNVGNVLSRVKTSTSLLTDRVRASEVATLGLVAQAFVEHADALERFLTEDERGRRLPQFLGRLAEVLQAEQDGIEAELRSLADAIEHIALVVSMQQVHSKGYGFVEEVCLEELVDQAISMSIGARRAEQIQIVREFDNIEARPWYRHKLLQILVNLLNNAKQAVLAGSARPPRIAVQLRRVARPGFEGVQIRVVDNGIGISAENLGRIFTFGFTTRRDGHGFGLHSAANLAQEMGGSLAVASDGPGAGATFTVEIPLMAEKVQT